VLNLLLELQARLKLTFLFVAHDSRWCATSPTASP
jgi:ABC-type dipeptide/oligopeptide/nickel transport system ATPase subunit